MQSGTASRDATAPTLSIHDFVTQLRMTLSCAISDCSRLGVEGTVLRVMCEDIQSMIGAVALPKPAASANEHMVHEGELPDDVIALKHVCEDLHEGTINLRCRLEAEEERSAELARKLDLRNTVVDELRRQVNSAAATRKESSAVAASVEFLDAVEKESAAFQLKAEEDMLRKEDAFRQQSLRHDRHYQRIIEAKDKEIVQIQLRFRNTLKAIQGAHAMNLDSLAQDNDRLKQQIAEATQVATQKAEAMFYIKLEEAEHQIRQETAAALRSKQMEVDRIHSQMVDLVSHTQSLEEEAQGYCDRLVLAQTEIKHLLGVELPFELHELRQELLAARTQLQSTAANASSEASRLQKELEELEARRLREVGQLADEVASLTSQLSSLRHDAAAKDAAMREANTGKLLLQQQLNATKDELRELLDEVEVLRRSTSEAVNDEWVAKYQALKEEYDEKLAAIRIELDESRRDADGYKHQVSRLREHVDAAEAKIADLEATLADLRRMQTRLEGTLQEYRSAKSALETEISVLRGEIERLQKSLDSSQELASKTKDELRNTASRLESSEKLVQQLQHQLARSAPPSPSNHGSRRRTPESGSPSPVVLIPAETTVGESMTRAGRDSVSPILVPPSPAGRTRDCSSQTSPIASKSVAMSDKSSQCVESDGKSTAKPSSRYGAGYTASGRADGASEEVRTTNARLRVELVAARLQLPAEIFDSPSTNRSPGPSNPSQLVEFEPIPITVHLDVIRQNHRFSSELQRRQRLVELEVGPTLRKDAGADSPTEKPKERRVAGDASTNRVAADDAKNTGTTSGIVASLASAKRPSSVDDYDEDHFLQPVHSTTPHGHSAGPPQTAQGGDHGPRELANRSATAVPALTSPPADYTGYIRVPYSMLPNHHIQVDSSGRETMQACVTMGAGFRRRPATARSTRDPQIHSPRARVRIVRPDSANRLAARNNAGHIPTKEYLDPGQYFNVSRLGHGHGPTRIDVPHPQPELQIKDVDEDPHIPEDRSVSTSPDASVPPKANLVVSAYFARSRHGGRGGIQHKPEVSATTAIQKSFREVMQERSSRPSQHAARSS